MGLRSSSQIFKSGLQVLPFLLQFWQYSTLLSYLIIYFSDTAIHAKPFRWPSWVIYDQFQVTSGQQAWAKVDATIYVQRFVNMATNYLRHDAIITMLLIMFLSHALWFLRDGWCSRQPQPIPHNSSIFNKKYRICQ